MKIKEVMDKNIPLVYANEPIEKALKLLVSIPEAAIPVVDRSGKVVGELSQHELLLLDIGDIEFHDEDMGFEEVKLLLAKNAKKVKDLMNKHEVTLSPDENVLMATKILYEEELSTIPIIDSKKKLVGIITDICILKHYKKILQKK